MPASRLGFLVIASMSFIPIFPGLNRVYQSNHTTHASFNSLQPLTAFTAISTPFSSVFFFPDVYPTRPSPTQHHPPSSVHLSLLLLGDNIHLDPGPSPSHLLLFTLSSCFFLTISKITALNDLTDNLQPGILAISETWVRITTTPSSPPGYYLFPASRTSVARLSKPPSA